MPTSIVLNFGQSLPVMQINHSYQIFKVNTNNLMRFSWNWKIYSTVNGLGSDDVRLSKRTTISSRN